MSHFLSAFGDEIIKLAEEPKKTEGGEEIVAPPKKPPRRFEPVTSGGGIQALQNIVRSGLKEQKHKELKPEEFRVWEEKFDLRNKPYATYRGEAEGKKRRADWQARQARAREMEATIKKYEKGPVGSASSPGGQASMGTETLKRMRAKAEELRSGKVHHRTGVHEQIVQPKSEMARRYLAVPHKTWRGGKWVSVDPTKPKVPVFNMPGLHIKAKPQRRVAKPATPAAPAPKVVSAPKPPAPSPSPVERVERRRRSTFGAYAGGVRRMRY